ncbi:uncharacterized protein LOC124665716 [Lolium rigidum]|uniref:uncharacterized protein LOC124665716 n=1 Tax=Lolium rigidum TaxID=89674 RepID=UPI001F5CF515|nr:uncharacterized protein LOC124665716 [Lolium rigidum]
MVDDRPAELRAATPRRRGRVDRHVRWGHVIRRIRVGLGELGGVGEGASTAWCCAQTVAYLCRFFWRWVTFSRIVKRKLTGDLCGVPYNMTLLNCLLSACLHDFMYYCKKVAATTFMFTRSLP